MLARPVDIDEVLLAQGVNDPGGMLLKRSKTHQAKGFDRVAVIGTEAASSAWHVVLANGVRIGFSGPVEEATLSAVLTAARRL